MDADYSNRRDVYPPIVNFAECPTFWTTDTKVKIQLVDYETTFMKKIEIYTICMGTGHNISFNIILTLLFLGRVI